MSRGHKVWIGADPGGRRCFGVAILAGDGPPHVECVSHAEGAVEVIQKQLRRRRPAGVGVDAPLWWSSGRSGDRHADRWLRKKHKLTGGEVQAANSLRGAALTQAAMFVYRMREVFPGVPVTETHPKALLKAVADGCGETFANRFGLNVKLDEEHARDALIGAIAAREGFNRRWPHDLSDQRLPTEQDPKAYWLAPVHYYWPVTDDIPNR